MSDTIENTKDLEASRTEALQGSLNSLGHTNDVSFSGATLSAEQCQKLSEKVTGILGDGLDRGLPRRGQPTQLLNEDGLPIIDISEPINEYTRTSISPSASLEQDIIPFSLLQPDEKERRKRESHRILDLLEEEERLQQIQEERDMEEERKEAIRKRKESAKAELDRLKTARGLQKRMGQALVRHGEGTEKGREEDARVKSQNTPSVAKNSVSFADAPDMKANKEDRPTSIPQSDWGYVAPGRLRGQNRIPLVSMADAQKYPMKMHVVERCPASIPTSPFRNDADSDDESTSSAEHLSCTKYDPPDERDRSSSSNGETSDGESLEEGFDLDTAQHHREIALEYHKKRQTIGVETAKAISAHTPDDCQKRETSNGQVPLSCFRADCITAAYDQSRCPISTSVGQVATPTSCQKSLRNSVRLGRLENDQLVGSGESGSEDEVVKEVIQMLRTGHIQNVGPDFKPASTTVAPPRNADDVEPPSMGTITAHGPKPSKFKLAHGGGISDTAAFQDSENGDKSQSRSAVLGVVERKAPRSFPSQHFLINKPPPQSTAKFTETVSRSDDC